MSRFKLVLLSMLAMLALGSVASASASAHRFVNSQCVPYTNALIAWETKAKCVAQNPAGGDAIKNWELEGIAAAKVEGTSGESILEGEVALVKVFIKCNKDTFSGELEATGASKGKVEFTECRVVNKKGNQIENCKVKEPIEFKFKDQLVSSPVEDEFKPAAGAIFVEITMEAEAGGVCAISGTYKVEGTQTCKLPSAGTLQAEHEIVCEPSGSSLKFAGNPATFTSTEKVKLESGGKWAME